MPCCDIHPRVMSPEDERRELEGDPMDWLPPEEAQRLSPVAGFYDGASVLLTGATGFVGTLLLEKLLRSCPRVSTVYVLVRDKRGVSLRQRLRSHLEKEIFRKARQACPDYLRKVVPIAGDCIQPGLGISPADAAELCSKVSVVFHVAATVRFNADLRTATNINVGSTCDLIALAKHMPNLKAFVYMSTAYSNCTRRDIDERYYPPPLKADELMRLLDIMDDEQLSQILPQVLGGWPNTYSFTKAVAEDVIRSEAAELPVSIIRPSIVSTTYREPVSLWAGSMYGSSSATAGSALGLLHVVPVNAKAVADFVPADMVVNATIACAWDTWRRHSTQTGTQRASTEPVIYNCVSSTRHPLTWGRMCRYAERNLDYPSIRNFWMAFAFPLKSLHLYAIGAVFLHLIPALIADTFLRLNGKKPILWNLYSRIHGVSILTRPFTIGEWTFKDDNMVSLLCRMGAVDRKLFPFDIRDADWEWLAGNVMRGVRFYLLDESFDNLEEARKKYRRLTVLHYVVVTIGSALLLLVLWRILAPHIGL